MGQSQTNAIKSETDVEPSKEPIKVSFPALGWSWIVFRTLLKDTPGIEIINPPKVTADIVRMGVKPSPEFVCFPMKVTMGEFMNMYEKFGVKNFVQALDCGPCRLGFYAPVQERIMRDLGYDVRIIGFQQFDFLNFEFLKVYDVLAPHQNKLFKPVIIIQSIRRALVKAKLIEDICRYEGLVRCREIHKGDTTRTVRVLMEKVDKEDDLLLLHTFDKVIKEEFRKIPIKRDFKPLRIIICGEIHCYMESYVNFDIIRHLGEDGIEVHQGLSLYDWIMHKLHLNFRRNEIERISKDYIPLDIGGEAQWVLGEYISKQREGFDGFIHIYPFTCMPEVTARGIIEGQSPDPFYLPIQFYSFDEHTGYEGMRTRIEAFIDLMKTNRQNNPKFKDKYVEPKEITEIFDEDPKSANLFAGIFENIKPFVNLFNDFGSTFLKNLSRPTTASLVTEAKENTETKKQAENEDIRAL